MISLSALNDWASHLETRLSGIRGADRFRSLRISNAKIDFASNDYLSLNADGTILKLFMGVSAAWEDEFGSTGSRLLRGHHEAFEEAENLFKNYVNAESALLFHSGYAANIGVIQTILSARDTIFCDRFCHATILDGIKISGAQRYYFDHNNLEDLENQIKKRSGRAGRRWIVTESIFSMDGDSPDLKALVSLAEKHDCLIILDEAHAIGVCGNNGAGLAVSENVYEKIAIRIFPCGKGPGLHGAFVCGPASLRDVLINECRSFIFSTAQPPMLAKLLTAIIQLLNSEDGNLRRTNLRNLTHRTLTDLNEAGMNTEQSTSHIIPIILGEEQTAMRWMQELETAGIDARAIRPPSVPQGTSRLRLNLQSGHTQNDISILLKELYRLRNQGIN